MLKLMHACLRRNASVPYSRLRQHSSQFSSFNRLPICSCLESAQSSKVFCNLGFRTLSQETISIPTVAGQARTFPPKITEIVEKISQLSLVEVADLNELLKKSLNISDASVMISTPELASEKKVDLACDNGEEAGSKVEKSLFTIRIMKYEEGKKVALIKEIKNVIPGMNLVHAKKFVESVPQTVRQDITKEEAEKLKTALEAVGANVEMN